MGRELHTNGSANGPRADLLHLFDALVQSDRGPAGFAGKLCLGLRGETGSRFWLVRFSGRPAQTEFCEHLPDDADTIVGLGESVARAILGLEPMPKEPLAVISGDDALWRRFISRYVKQQTPLSLRLGCRD